MIKVHCFKSLRHDTNLTPKKKHKICKKGFRWKTVMFNAKVFDYIYFDQFSKKHDNHIAAIDC